MINQFIFIFSLLLLSLSTGFGQQVFPYINNQRYLMSFEEGVSRQIDFLLPTDVKYSEKIIAFIDSKNDLFVYDGERKDKLTGFANDYKIGRNLVAWNTGPVINVWEDGEKQNLTYFGGRYVTSDSLVVFEDTRDNAINVYYKGKIHTLYYSIDRPTFPNYIGSNTVGFRGNGDVYYAFVAGEIVEIGVNNVPIKWAPGGNLIAFNDPFNQSFSAVLGNEVVDVDQTIAQSYKTGYDIIAFVDRNGELRAYIDNEMVTLSTFPSEYDVFRNTVIWNENGMFFTYYNGEKIEIANYLPTEYQIGTNIVAFRNQNGGISAFYDGQVGLVSNLAGAPFEVNGSTIKIQINNFDLNAYFNGSKTIITQGNYSFFNNGKTYQK